MGQILLFQNDSPSTSCEKNPAISVLSLFFLSVANKASATVRHEQNNVQTTDSPPNCCLTKQKPTYFSAQTLC